MRILSNGVHWDDLTGVGFFDVKFSDVYNEDYFRKYVKYEAEPMGKPLNDFRLSIVNEKVGEGAAVVDIGIGCGTFVASRNDGRGPTFGYDVNPSGVRWLVEKGLWWDPWFRRPPSACFWDSLEHLEQPELLLGRVEKWIFVSVPIFLGPEHVVRSKHFRPTEHFWYFTRGGLIDMFASSGFELAEESDGESQIGREDIGTFAFRRIS